MTHNILYIANSAKIGGANRVLMDLISGLDRKSFTPAAVVPDAGPLVDWLATQGVLTAVIPASDGSNASALRRMWKIRAFMKVSRTTFMHAIDPACYREASWAAWLTGACRVCHIQFPPSIDFLKWSFRIKPHLAISCYSAHVAEVLTELPELKDVLTALPNAVHIEQFPARTSIDTNSPWRFGRNKMAIIVGHLSDIKGHPSFVEAAAIVRSKHPDCSFVALGGETIQPGFQKVLERSAAKLGILGHLHFLGWRENVSEIVRAADVFVLPSLKEGLPLAMLEAMASGVPIVATPVNGIPDVISDGENGLLVPVQNPSALASAIIRIFDDPALAANLSAAGRATVEHDFSMQKLVATMQHMYRALLQGDWTPTDLQNSPARVRA